MVFWLTGRKTCDFSQAWSVRSNFWSTLVCARWVFELLKFNFVVYWLGLSVSWMLSKGKVPFLTNFTIKPQTHGPILFLCVITNNHRPQEYLNHLTDPAIFILIGLVFTVIIISAFCRFGATHSEEGPCWHADTCRQESGIGPFYFLQ